MKKETARMIKTAAAGIVMLAAVICYNVEWKGSGDTAQFHLTALQEETAEEGTDALAPAGVENHSPEYAVQWSREAAAYPGISAGADGGAVTSKINLNTAVKEQLMTLKGIGEARAEAIIAYRQEYGPFARIEDIMEVPGIKEAAFQKIKEDITV